MATPQTNIYSPQKIEIPVTLVTDHYSYLGQLDTGGRRLQDILNDALTDYLSLRDVKVATTVDGRTIVQELPTATIVKNNVLLGLLRQETHEAPIKRQNYRVRRDFCEAAIVINEIRIHGAIHLPRSSSHAAAILARDLKSFFAVTDATIAHGPGDESSTTAEVVLVNQHALSLFHVNHLGK